MFGVELWGAGAGLAVLPHLDLVAHAQHVANRVDAVVADLADVQQPAHAASQVQESPVQLHRLHGAQHHITHLQDRLGLPRAVDEPHTDCGCSVGCPVTKSSSGGERSFREEEWLPASELEGRSCTSL